MIWPNLLGEYWKCRQRHVTISSRTEVSFLLAYMKNNIWFLKNSKCELDGVLKISMPIKYLNKIFPGRRIIDKTVPFANGE